jgi:hypothetical protein
MPASLGRALRPNPIAAAIRTNPTNSGEVQSAGRSKAPARAATARCDQITVPADADETRRNGHTGARSPGLVQATVGRRPTRQGRWHAKPGDLTTLGRRKRPLTSFRASFRASLWASYLVSFWATCRRHMGPGARSRYPINWWPSASLHSPMAHGDVKRFGSAVIDLHELCMGPFDRIGRRHALDGLRVHVDDDVLGLHLGCFLIGRPGITCQPPGHRDLLERR